MLRSPLVALGRYGWSASAVIVALAVILWFGAAAGAAVYQLEVARGKWWESFLPLVYLEADVEPQVVGALEEELRGWSGVKDVEVLGPAVALQDLQDRLGEEEVQRLGVDQGMMPTTFVLSPGVWRPGQADLVARLKALEVREEVIGVDVPEAKVLQWIARGQQVLMGLGVAVLIGLFGGLGSLASFLRRLQEAERQENHLLEVFGASPGALRRATFWRGVVMGAAAGLVAGAGFLPWALALDGLVAPVVGLGAEGAALAALGAMGLVLIGLLLGGVTGWVVGEPAKEQAPGRMEGLLRWEWERG